MTTGKTDEKLTGADRAAADDQDKKSPVVYHFKGKKLEDGTPLEFVWGIPARDLTQADVDSLTLNEVQLDEIGRVSGFKNVAKKTLEDSDLYERKGK